MYRKILTLAVLTAFGLVMSAATARTQDFTREYHGDEEEQDYRDHPDDERARIDRYLDAEIWVDHDDGEYYEGDNIVVSFRTNRDAFVAIYSVDSRGRVNLLFPTSPARDNFIRGGVTYHLPGDGDDFDLVVTGPDGVENMQLVASRDRFPIPDWYPSSGLVFDGEDRHEYMDYLNERYFVRYGGQRFAYDRTAAYIYEWEPSYFRPIYYPRYYPWTVCGNVYFDYPIGGSIYIDGIYWGVAPLYIPRIYVGWHTITVYDPYGWGWESDCHISRYHTLVLGHDVIRTSPTVVSKYKEVRFSGYRNPVINGYPQYAEKYKTIMKSSTVAPKVAAREARPDDKQQDMVFTGSKKYARGDSKLIVSGRGIETAGPSIDRDAQPERGRKMSGKTWRSDEPGRDKSAPAEESARVGDKRSSSGKERSYRPDGSKRDTESSSGYYRKSSGGEVERGSKVKHEAVQRSK
ncbi:MAG TPA: DUF4384 domain-containing protein, partial [Candidatus Deferrimicrobium sp.]|nr:DUF4384 domain-containing protein [Candidatus Deferrimicrobium sp.]